jgi:hypothetical protein
VQERLAIRARGRHVCAHGSCGRQRPDRMCGYRL